jgi:hypothetical protein
LVNPFLRTSKGELFAGVQAHPASLYKSGRIFLILADGTVYFRQVCSGVLLTVPGGNGTYFTRKFNQDNALYHKCRTLAGRANDKPPLWSA